MPEEMYEDLVHRLPRTRYASVSEYIRDLIRKDEIGQDSLISSDDDGYDLTGIFTIASPADSFPDL